MNWSQALGLDANFNARYTFGSAIAVNAIAIPSFLFLGNLAEPPHSLALFGIALALAVALGLCLRFRATSLIAAGLIFIAAMPVMFDAGLPGIGVVFCPVFLNGLAVIRLRDLVPNDEPRMEGRK